MGIEFQRSVVAPGGAVMTQTPQSGYYYSSPVGVSTGSSTPALNEWQALPFWVPKQASFDRIGVEVTGTTASAVVRLGVVGDSGDMTPGDLILDAGTIDAASSTGFKEATIDLTLDPGTYWLTNCSQVAAPSLRLFTLGHQMIGTTAPASSSISIGYRQSSVTGAFPASYTFGGINSSSARVYIRAA